MARTDKKTGKLSTGSRVQSFPCAVDTALSLLHLPRRGSKALAGAEKTSPLPSPPPDILLADSFTIPFSLAEFPEHKIHEKSQVSFCKPLDNKNWHVKEKPRFQLNSHTLAFGLKTHRVESPCTA